MRIAILGFGREGRAVLRFLLQSKSKDDIWILDKDREIKPSPKLHQKLGRNYLSGLSDFDLVFRSPGVPYNLPEIQDAIKNGARFSSSTALFFEKAKGAIIGVTGTKGKGTVSTLLYRILKASGKDVYLAGNIGKTSIELLPTLKKNSVAVLELSSFQLQDLKHSSSIALITEVFPDHLDAHENLKEYFRAKSNICRYQRKGDTVFFFADNGAGQRIAACGKGKKVPVSEKNFRLFQKEDLKIPGRHNFRNAVMAAEAALYLGCPKNKVISAVRSFRGNEHRLEFVREIDGIRFCNDSASTNPETAVAAIEAFSGPKILIAGGKDKNLDYKPLAQALKSSDTRLVILFGENRNKINTKSYI